MKLNQIFFRRLVTGLLTFLVGVAAVLVIHGLKVSETFHEPVKNSSPIQPIFVSNDDYAVFSAILEHLKGSETFVVGDYVWGDSSIDPEEFIRRYDLSEDTVSNFQIKNRERRKLEHKFTTSQPVFLLSREEEDILFPKGGAGWERFYQKFPKAKGIIYFSNVGFNAKKNEALVNVIYQCNGVYYNSGYYSLKMAGGRWIIYRAARGGMNVND